MKTCGQTSTQSVLEHGFSVKNYLFDLLDHLEHNTPLKYQWVLPDWIYENRDFLLQSLPPRDTLKLYTIMHDCGKPFCITINEDGRRHFPNHAEVSYQTFSQLYNDPIAAELIRRDMDIHLLKADGVDDFCNSPMAITSLIVGIAEIHSNASMFGGIGSTSFKIKNKSISQRGKQIISKIKQ